MSLRTFSGWLLAPAVVVAVTAVGAHAHTVGGAGADVDAAFGRGMLQAAARDGFSTALRSDRPREDGEFSEGIEVASRCSRARSVAGTSSRSRRSSSGSRSGARRKATIWNIPSQTEATGQRGGEASGRGGGFYDENGNFHPDGTRP